MVANIDRMDIEDKDAKARVLTHVAEQVLAACDFWKVLELISDAY